MTISIATQDPQPAATSVSRGARQRLSLASDDVLRPVLLSSVNAWLAGANVIVSGASVDGRSTISANGLGGFDLVLAPSDVLPPGDLVTVRVTAEDTVSASTIDDTWTFTAIEDLGPRINHALSTPAPSGNPPSSPASVTVFVSDAQLNAVDFSITGANVEYVPPPPIGAPPPAANQVYFEATGPNDGMSFRGMEGRRILVAGQWRTIVSVQGPGLATYDGAQLSGTSVSVDVYRRAGLDVVVDGLLIVETGQDAGSGWSPVVTSPVGGVQVTMSPSVTWVDGVRVPVFVRAVDADGDVSELSYDFIVGQAQGPTVSNISPGPGVRGLPVGPGATSDLAFRLSSVANVDHLSINVLVDGVAAVSAGVGVGDYSSSTVTPFAAAADIDVVLKKTGAYADGRIVHVDVSSADGAARSGERRVWSVQYGTATGARAATAMGGEIPGDDVVRVCAYDLSDNSFCRPVEMRHSGFAADGFWYESGSRTGTVATWFTALGQFPAGGQLVVTATGGWAILPTLASAPWAQCPQFVGSGWNMAGNAAQPLTDGDFASAAPVLALASALGLVVVDFAADRAWLATGAGRTIGALDINQRTLNQDSGDVDVDAAIDASAISRLATGVDGTVIVLCQSAALTVVRGSEVRSQAYSTSWSRARVSGARFAVAHNDLGQGSVEVWSLEKFFSGLGMDDLYDDMSTPPLPADVVSDIDFAEQVLFVATPASLEAVDTESATSSSHVLADLGLTGAGVLAAVSACHGSTASYGHVYVGADSPGRVTRFRLHWPSAPDRAVVVVDGVAVSSLSAAGFVTDFGDSYLRLSMDIAP